MTECYFTPKKGTTSATICANCGLEKYLHTIGDGIKPSKVEIITQSNNIIMKTATIGELISEAIKLHELDTSIVEQELGLPSGIMQKIMSDNFYTNSIPVVLFRNLIVSLHIPLSKIEMAIMPTFKFMQSKETKETIRKKPMGYALWENEESVIKYTNRLKELRPTPQQKEPQSTTSGPSKEKIEGLIKKYTAFFKNIEWHIKTNKPTGEDLEICKKQLSEYSDILSDLRTL